MSTISSTTTQPNLSLTNTSLRAPGEEPQARTQEAAQAGPAAKTPAQDRVEAGAEPPARSVEEVFATLQGEPPVNADAARLLALNVRQQLQGQDAAIANLRPNSVLSLLR